MILACLKYCISKTIGYLDDEGVLLVSCVGEMDKLTQLYSALETTELISYDKDTSRRSSM